MPNVLNFHNADNVLLGDVDLSTVNIGSIPVWNEWASLPDFEEPPVVPAAADASLPAPTIVGVRHRYSNYDCPSKISCGLTAAVTSPHSDPVLGYVWQAKPTDACGFRWRNDQDWTPEHSDPSGKSYANAVPETDGWKTLKWIYHLLPGTYNYQINTQPGPADSPDVIFMGLKMRDRYSFRCCAYTARGYGAWSAEKTINLNENYDASMLVPGVGSSGDDWKPMAARLNLSVRNSNQTYPGHVRAQIIQSTLAATGYTFEWRRVEQLGEESAWTKCTKATPIDGDGNNTAEPATYYILEGIPKDVRVEVRAFTKTADGTGTASYSTGVANSYITPTAGGTDSRPVPPVNWPVYDDRFSCVNYGLRWFLLDQAQSRANYAYRDATTSSMAGSRVDATTPIAFMAKGGSMPTKGRLVHLGRDSGGTVRLVTADDDQLNWVSHPLPTPPSFGTTTISKTYHQALCWNPTLNEFLIGVYFTGNPYAGGYLATAPSDLSTWTVVKSWTSQDSSLVPILGPHAFYPCEGKFWNLTDGKHSTDGVTWSALPSTPADFDGFVGQPRKEGGEWIVEAAKTTHANRCFFLHSADLQSWQWLADGPAANTAVTLLPSGSQSDHYALPDHSVPYDSHPGRRPQYDGTACWAEGWDAYSVEGDGTMTFNGIRLIGTSATQGVDQPDIIRYADMPTPPPECGDFWWCPEHLPSPRLQGPSRAVASTQSALPTGKYVVRGFDLPKTLGGHP